MAKGSAAELATQLEIAQEIGLIPEVSAKIGFRRQKRSQEC